MTAGAPLLSVENLSVRSGATDLLRDLSFGITHGERLFVVGPNGAGKSTLLKTLIRALRPDGGRIRIGGRDLRRLSQPALARMVAYVPQAAGLPLPFTVRDFVLMGRFAWQRLFGSSGESDRRAADRALALTGMSAFADRTLGTLSGGELQKVLIAGALAQEAKLLLLDEPTTFLDPRYREEVRRLLAGLHREGGVALLTVTHDLGALAIQGGSVLALREGASVYHGPAEDFLTPDRLRRVYGTEFVLAPHPETGTLLPLPSVEGSA